jgi:hypothetical protein
MLASSLQRRLWPPFQWYAWQRRLQYRTERQRPHRVLLGTLHTMQLVISARKCVV